MFRWRITRIQFTKCLEWINSCFPVLWTNTQEIELTGNLIRDSDSHSDTDIRRRRMIFRSCMTEFLTCTISCHSIMSVMKQCRTRLRYVILIQSGCEPRWQVHLCDLRITNSSTKANQARMKPTVTYSRSSITPIKCQVFYSKDTVKIGGMSIAEYIFADVTDVSGQDNTNACECISSISFEQRI